MSFFAPGMERREPHFSKLHLKFEEVIKISVWYFHVSVRFGVFPGLPGSCGQDGADVVRRWLGHQGQCPSG